MNNKERNFMGVEQLSLRSLIIGALGSCVITASSMYVALRMSALPWPTIFVAVLSMGLLKLFGKTTNNEINITQTAMSAGAMVAGGIAFTLPGLWIMGIWKGSADFSSNYIKVLAIAIAGMLLGSVTSYILRYRYIVKNALPFPIGQAAAETIKAGDDGGKKSVVLFGTMFISTVYTFLRDQIGLIPNAFMLNKNSPIGVWNSPMAVGMGYILGALYTGVWFLGALFSNVFLIPFGPRLGLFPNKEAASSFTTGAGIGLLVGTGLGVLAGIIYSYIKKLKNRQKDVYSERTETFKNKNNIFNPGRILIVSGTVIAFIFTVAAGIPVLPSVLLIIGIYVVSLMAATITGQTGINPMEIFGIIILLAIRVFVKIDAMDALMIAACTAIASGFSGDLFNDYKAGQILGTNPKAQLISQIVGGVVGTVVASLALFAIINQFGEIGSETALPAAQAVGVSAMINGIGNPVVFGIAVGIGAVLYLLGLPTATLGIGVFLPFTISSAVFIGGVIRFIADRVRSKSSEDDAGTVAASGLLGGEGITGVGIALVKMFTRS